MSTPVVTTEDMACLADVARELRHSETGAALRHLARHRQQAEASFKAREDALVEAFDALEREMRRYVYDTDPKRRLWALDKFGRAHTATDAGGE